MTYLGFPVRSHAERKKIFVKWALLAFTLALGLIIGLILWWWR